MAVRLGQKVTQALGPGYDGVEIGGLLLGSVSGDSPILVTLDDYALVPCDYAFGSLYRLTTQDQERFARCIAARSAVGGPRIVGFFRSHTRQGLALDADDVSLYTAQFGQPHQVVLLIQPRQGESSGAGIFIWEDGTIHATAPYLEFPFSYEALRQEGRPEPDKPVAPAVSEQPVDRPGGLSHDPEKAPEAAATPVKRAQIVPIVPEAATVSAGPVRVAAAPKPDVALSAAQPVEAPRCQGVSGAEWLPGRVGRCCVKVRFLPAPMANSEGKGR